MTNDTPTHVSGSSHWSHLVTLPADHESVETGQLHCPEQSKIHSVYSGFASLSNQSPYRSASHSFVFKNPNLPLPLQSILSVSAKDYVSLVHKTYMNKTLLLSLRCAFWNFCWQTQFQEDVNLKSHLIYKVKIHVHSSFFLTLINILLYLSLYIMIYT